MPYSVTFFQFVIIPVTKANRTIYFQPPSPFIFNNAHVTSAKHTGLVRFGYWSEIFVILFAFSQICSAGLSYCQKSANLFFDQKGANFKTSSDFIKNITTPASIGTADSMAENSLEINDRNVLSALSALVQLVASAKSALGSLFARAENVQPTANEVVSVEDGCALNGSAPNAARSVNSSIVDSDVQAIVVPSGLRPSCLKLDLWEDTDDLDFDPARNPDFNASSSTTSTGAAVSEAIAELVKMDTESRDVSHVMDMNEAMEMSQGGPPEGGVTPKNSSEAVTKLDISPECSGIQEHPMNIQVQGSPAEQSGVGAVLEADSKPRGGAVLEASIETVLATDDMKSSGSLSAEVNNNTDSYGATVAEPNSTADSFAGAVDSLANLRISSGRSLSGASEGDVPPWSPKVACVVGQVQKVCWGGRLVVRLADGGLRYSYPHELTAIEDQVCLTTSFHLLRNIYISPAPY